MSNNAAYEDWVLLTSNGEKPKLKEIREFVKKHKLSVKTYTGGPSRRKTADVVADVRKVLNIETTEHSEQLEQSEHSEPSEPVLQLPETKKNTPSSSNHVIDAEESAPSLHPDFDETSLLALAEKGDGKKVISWVNEFNLSNKLSKNTLKCIVQDCSKAGKK